MTRIFFYYNAPDRISASAALIAKACRKKKDIFVYAPDAPLADALDRRLWSSPSTSFVPHVRASSPLSDRTPVIIADSMEARRQTERILNLSDTLPPGFAEFDALIEVIGHAEDEKLAGRERAKFYKDRGYAIEYFNLQEHADE